MIKVGHAYALLPAPVWMTWSHYAKDHVGLEVVVKCQTARPDVSGCPAGSYWVVTSPVLDKYPNGTAGIWVHEDQLAPSSSFIAAVYDYLERERHV